LISIVLNGCISSRIPFNFERDIDSAFLMQSLQLQRNAEVRERHDPRELEMLPSDLGGEANIYHTRFLEGWLVQDNFVDLAVLNKDRESDFVSYNGAFKHVYDSYLIFYKLKSGNRMPFLLFTVQANAGVRDTVSGFGKIYIGELGLNTKTWVLGATRILSMKQTNGRYFTKEIRKTNLQFILNKEPNFSGSDFLTIKKIAISDENELSGNKTIEITIDEVMGKPNSLIFRNYRKIKNAKE